MNHINAAPAVHREDWLAELISKIDVLVKQVHERHGRMALVGIDGVDGSGKTMLADELCRAIEARSLFTVMRSSVDGFHHPRSHRYRQGRHSPEGFFLDSYNYVDMKTVLLEPIRNGACDVCRTRIYDVDADQAVSQTALPVPDQGVLIMDGIFLHRDELSAFWDFSIFLYVSPAVSVARNLGRAAADGVDINGVSADPWHSDHRRYVDGQALYLETCQPWRHADMIIDSEVVASPRPLSTDQYEDLQSGWVQDTRGTGSDTGKRTT
ncbi:MAG: uridine kinase [Pseudomonadota bacterium]